MSEAELRAKVKAAARERGIVLLPQTGAWGNAGAPDFVGIGPRGEFVGLELKAPGGKLSRLQQVIRDRIQNAGGLYIVAETVEEALAPWTRN